jgi:voltage-gated potassium channel Kch
VATFSLLISFSTLFFHLQSSLPLSDAFVFTLTTLSTVGTGDVLPVPSKIGRLVIMALSASGVAGIGGVAGIVARIASRRTWTRPLLVVFSLIYSGSIGLFLLEHPRLSGFEALYLACNTLTTLGLGDVVPGTTRGKIFTGLFSLVGSVIFGAVVGRLAALPIEKEEERAREEVFQRIPDEVSPELLQELVAGERMKELGLSKSRQVR